MDRLVGIHRTLCSKCSLTFANSLQTLSWVPRHKFVSHLWSVGVSQAFYNVLKTCEHTGNSPQTFKNALSSFAHFHQGAHRKKYLGLCKERFRPYERANFEVIRRRRSFRWHSTLKFRGNSSLVDVKRDSCTLQTRIQSATLWGHLVTPVYETSRAQSRSMKLSSRKELVCCSVVNGIYVFRMISSNNKRFRYANCLGNNCFRIHQPGFSRHRL